jgi:acyl-CoA synthetase (AMP-forming)/AMP-acid ligase II
VCCVLRSHYSRAILSDGGIALMFAAKQCLMAAANGLAGHLAHFKVPKFFHFTNEFPVTVTGKVRKVEMREMAKKILGL